MEDIRDFSKDELEKLKLREEIRKLKNPLWKEISFISIIATLIIAFASASISIWRLKSNKISELELQKEILLKEKKQVQLESENTNKLYNEALSKNSIPSMHLKKLL